MFERVKNVLGLGDARGLTDTAREMGYGDGARHDAPSREERIELARDRRAERQLDVERELRERAESGEPVPGWMTGSEDDPGTRAEILARRERMDREMRMDPDQSMIPPSIRDDVAAAREDHERDVERIDDVTGDRDRDRDAYPDADAYPDVDRESDRDDDRMPTFEEQQEQEEEQEIESGPERSFFDDLPEIGENERNPPSPDALDDESEQKQEPELTDEDYREHERQKVLEREKILYEYDDVTREDLASSEKEQAFQSLDRQKVIEREQNRLNPHPLLTADDDREQEQERAHDPDRSLVPSESESESQSASRDDQSRDEREREPERGRSR